jgi:hypothetical protein
MSLLSMVSPSHLGSGDDVQPRNTEAVVSSVSPQLPDSVLIDIVGTDTFVRVRSDGHNVTIPGYEQEPYIEFSDTNVVRVNVNSITYQLNQTRYGSDVPEITTDEVEWETVSTSGEYMWHDHRVHWMSQKPPATMNDDGLIQTWVIPLIVDGQDVTVSGELYLRDAASRLWWGIGAVVLVLAVMLSLVQRRALLLLLLAVSVAGAIIGALEFLGLPSEARITPLMFIFSIVAVLLSIVAIVSDVKNRNVIVDPVVAGIGLTFLVLTWQVRDQVRAFYVPGLEAEFLARVVIPSIFGAGIVALVDGVRRVVFPDSDGQQVARTSVT